MLTKEAVLDTITVDEHGNIMYREVTRIMEDGKELAKSYHRSSLMPGAALTGVEPKVASIANVVWTPAVVAAANARAAATSTRVGI